MKSGFILICLLLNAAVLTVAQSPVEKHGRLQVEGNRINDQNGHAAQLRGISFSWSIWAGKKYYNPAVTDWLIKDFNVSIIRVSMAVQPAGGYLDNPDEQLRLVTTVTDHALNKGIYVLLDWHDHNSEKHVKQATKFFGIMAKRYSGKPNIIYEIWNEPEQQSWQVVKDYATEVIREIRKSDKSNLIIVGSPHWDQDVDMVTTDPISGFANIAYSFHFYASDPNHQHALRAKADLALQGGIPLFVTEWGVGEANGDGRFDLAKTEEWMNWMEQKKLSWVNWNITDKKETTALLKPGASAKGGWKEEQLSPAGIYIRSKLRVLNRN